MPEKPKLLPPDIRRDFLRKIQMRPVSAEKKAVQSVKMYRPPVLSPGRKTLRHKEKQRPSEDRPERAERKDRDPKFPKLPAFKELLPLFSENLLCPLQKKVLGLSDELRRPEYMRKRSGIQPLRLREDPLPDPVPGIG